jgi:hypothetical protein
VKVTKDPASQIELKSYSPTSMRDLSDKSKSVDSLFPQAVKDKERKLSKLRTFAKES